VAANCTSLLGFLAVTKVFRSLPDAGNCGEPGCSGSLAGATGKYGWDVCVSGSVRVAGASPIFSRAHRRILSYSSGLNPLSAAAIVRTASRSSGFAIRCSVSTFGLWPLLGGSILANKEILRQ